MDQKNREDYKAQAGDILKPIKDKNKIEDYFM